MPDRKNLLDGILGPVASPVHLLTDDLVDRLSRDVLDGFLIAMMVGELIVSQFIPIAFPP